MQRVEKPRNEGQELTREGDRARQAPWAHLRRACGAGLLSHESRMPRAQVVLLVMAYSSWHSDLWLEWSRLIPVHFLVHFCRPDGPGGHDGPSHPRVRVARTAPSDWADLMGLQLHLLREMQLAYPRFSSCMFVSGECVPCIKPSSFMSALSSLRGCSICQHDPVRPRRQVKGMRVYEGPNWMLLARAHVQYMCGLPQNTIDAVASVRLRPAPQHDSAANNDEFGLVTLLANSSHRAKICDAPITDYVIQYGVRHPLRFDRLNAHLLRRILLNETAEFDTAELAWSPWECVRTRFAFRKVADELQDDVRRILQEADIL